MMAHGSLNGDDLPPQELIPSHMAAASNNIQELARLVREGASLIDPSTKETALHAAAQHGANETLTWLLINKKGSPLDKALSGSTAAHLAVVYGHLEALKLLINYDSHVSIDVATATDGGGLSILSLATLQDELEMVTWIVDNYPQVAEIPNATGNLAVHYAAASGYLSILKFLVGRLGKGMAEKADKQNTRPVFFAAQEGRLEVLDYLINKLSVDPVARDSAGMSTVHTATQACQPKAVKWLIKKLGPEYILDRTVDGATPLHMAAALGQCEILQFLLDKLKDKRDVNITDTIHATPAHDAAEGGQMDALLLLLRHGADLTIRDTENKTPYELAVDQHHTELASMIADFRENGPDTLSKYERKSRDRRTKERASSHGHYTPRTSKDEAAEIADAIQQQSEMIHHKKGRTSGTRQADENGYHKTRHNYDEDEIQHATGPHGDTYAVPHKRKHHHKGGPRLGGESEDFMGDHTSLTRLHKQSPFDRVFPIDEAGPHINVETASNYSRPSRVKKWQDSDSDLSSFVSSKYRSGRHNVPGFYPKPYEHLLPPHSRGPRSSRSARSARSGYSGYSRSSKHSSRIGRRGYYRGYPPPPAPYMYGAYPHGMMPAYVGYAYPYQHGYRPKTTEERMHMAALQHSQPPMGIRLLHPGAGMPVPQGRRAAVMEKHGIQPVQPKPYTDTDIGYGPAASTSHQGDSHTEGIDFHPAAPPVTKKGGKVSKGSVKEQHSYNSNFILTKRTETAEARQAGDTTLNPSKDRQPEEYDGRWDDYIMTDSDDDFEVDDRRSVAFACEAVAILAIGCSAGLKGLKNARKGKPLHVSELMAEKPHVWLDTKAVTKKTKKDHKRKSNASPELEAQELVINFGGNGEGLDENHSSEENGTMTSELCRQGSVSVTEQFEQKLLSDSFAARDSSMLNIAGMSMGSQMSMVSSAEEEDDDLKDEDAISVVHGISMAAPRKTEVEEKPGHEPDEGKKRDRSKKGKSKKKDKKDKKSKEGKRKGKEDESKSSSGESKKAPVTKETPRRMKIEPSSPKQPKQPEHRLVSVSTPEVKAKEKRVNSESRTKKEPPSKEHTVSVSIPVGQEGPREVPNEFFIDQSDGEEPAVAPSLPAAGKQEPTLEQLEESLQSWTADLDRMLEDTTLGSEGLDTSTTTPKGTGRPVKPVRPAPSPPTRTKSQDKKAQGTKHYTIEADPMTEEIFSKEGLDELNDALRELTAIGQMGASSDDDEDGQHDAASTRPQSSFEKNLLATLQALNETMSKLKASPTTTQTEIHQQQEIQQQLIQNVLTYCQNNPQLTLRLLTILQQSKEDTTDSSSSTAQLITNDLEQKLLDAQEKQFRQTTEHFRNQEEFQQAIQRKLEEQADQQMRGIQANFDKYAKVLEQQLADQRRSWEQEMKRREEESHGSEKKHKSKDKKHRKGKKHKKRYHGLDSDSDTESESEDGMVQPTNRIGIPTTPAVKTMEAKILYTTSMLESDDGDSIPDPPPVPSVTNLLGKKSSVLARRGTNFELIRTQEAIKMLEGDDDEEDEDDEDGMQFQRAKPATVRRADIKYQPQQEGYTPHRNPGSRQTAQQQRATVSFADDGTQGQTAEIKRIGAAGEKYSEFHVIKRKPPKTIEVQDDAPEYDEKSLKYGHSHVEPNAHKQLQKEDEDPLAGAGSELAAALKLRQKQLHSGSRK